MATLLLLTGLRLSEAAALQLVHVRISARMSVVVARSGEDDAYREVELNALVRAMLDEWVTERAKIAQDGERASSCPNGERPVIAIDRSRGAATRSRPNGNATAVGYFH